ncbi:hypothetical protein B484DRAFT_484654 [Ochromonadaceae sp. CCMP2298]|nr:hypothetical protein B484DRAFT_484654 [Ochromonadaceae sp. CCMP2298]
MANQIPVEVLLIQASDVVAALLPANHVDQDTLAALQQVRSVVNLLEAAAQSIAQGQGTTAAHAMNLFTNFLQNPDIDALVVQFLHTDQVDLEAPTSTSWWTLKGGNRPSMEGGLRTPSPLTTKGRSSSSQRSRSCSRRSSRRATSRTSTTSRTCTLPSPPRQPRCRRGMRGLLARLSSRSDRTSGAPWSSFSIA